MTAKEQEWLLKWMQEQEEINREVAKELLLIESRLEKLEQKSQALDSRTRHLILYR